MFILVKLIDDCKVRVYVSLYGKLKIEHYTFFINYDLIMIYFVLYMGLLIFVAHFRMSPYIFLHQANTIFWGLLLSPIPFVGRSVFPSVSLLIFEEQLFVLAAFVWSRCPQSSHSYRTYRCFCGVSYVRFWRFFW